MHHVDPNIADHIMRSARYFVQSMQSPVVQHIAQHGDQRMLHNQMFRFCSTTAQGMSCNASPYAWSHVLCVLVGTPSLPCVPPSSPAANPQTRNKIGEIHDKSPRTFQSSLVQQGKNDAYRGSTVALCVLSPSPLLSPQPTTHS